MHVRMSIPLRIKSCFALTTAALLAVPLFNGQPAHASKEGPGTGAVSFSLSTLKGKRLTQLLPGQFCLIRDDEHKFVRTVVDRPEVVGLSVIGKNLVTLEAVGPGVAIVSFADDGDNWLAFEVQVEKTSANKSAAGPAVLDLSKSKSKFVSTAAGRIMKVRELDFKVATANPAVAAVVPKKDIWPVSPDEKAEYFQIWAIEPGMVKLGKVNGSDFELKVLPIGAGSKEQKYAPLMTAVPSEKEAAVYLKLARYWRDQYFQIRKGGASKSNVRAEVFRKFAIDCFERAEKLDAKCSALEERQAFLKESGK